MLNNAYMDASLQQYLLFPCSLLWGLKARFVQMKDFKCVPVLFCRSNNAYVLYRHVYVYAQMRSLCWECYFFFIIIIFTYYIWCCELRLRIVSYFSKLSLWTKVLCIGHFTYWDRTLFTAISWEQIELICRHC